MDASDEAHRNQKTLKFINEEAGSIHGGIKTASVFPNQSGEWKLGGFELLSSIKDDDAVIYVCFTNAYQIPFANRERPTEA